MVSVIFNSVYLFLVLFAFPQVRAAPSAAALDLYSRATDAQMLDYINGARALSRPSQGPLKWSNNGGAYATLQIAVCRKDVVPGVAGTSTDVLPLFTEDAHF